MPAKMASWGLLKKRYLKVPKLLEKPFITKKFTQCKTSGTLKTDIFQIPDYKKIGKLFPK